MSSSRAPGGILTRWPVSASIAVSADDLGPRGVPTDAAFERWYGLAWDRYLERCPTLRAELARGTARLAAGPLRLSRRRRLVPGEIVLVAIAATELWPAGFEMALRARVLGEEGGRVVDGRRSISLAGIADDVAIAIPDEVRSELIAVEATAAEYC